MSALRQPDGSWTRVTVAALSAFVVITALIYWQGLGGGFIFDDLPNLVNSQTWKIGSFTPAALHQALESDISGALGRPLAMLSFAANHVWSGLDPFALKLTNLALHLFNGLLVYAVCRELFSLTVQDAGMRERMPLASALVTAAWLLHPLQVSTVLYIVQRMEIGAATGALGCLAAYLVARRRQGQCRPCVGWFALAGLMLLVGLGFKESALVALPLLLLVESLVLRFRDSQGGLSKPLLVLHAAWLIPASLVYALIVVPSTVQGDAYASRDFGAIQRLLSQGPILAMYVGQILWPMPEKMLFYYDQLRAPDGLFSPLWTAYSWSLLAALVALAFWLRRRWPLASLGILWFFVCHFLTSNVIPLELAFEHRNYLALLGPVLAACEGISRLTHRLHGDAAFGLGLAPVLALAGLCLIQVSTWGHPFHLSAALAGRNPDSPRANYAFGAQLHSAAQGDTTSPQWTLARRQFEVAARLPGSSALADQALVIMDSSQGSPVSEELWRMLESKLLGSRLVPENVSALHSVVACRLASRCEIPDKAVLGLLQRMQEVHPEAFVLAIIRANFVWNGLGDREAALGVLRDSRARDGSPHEVDLALVEFLLASTLHEDWVEAQAVLAELSTRDLPPESREKVRIFQASLAAAKSETGLQE